MILPPTLNAAGLAQLLPISKKTILRDVTRTADKLPPLVCLGKKKICLTHVALRWLVGRLNRLCEVDFGGLIVSASSRNHQQEPGVQMDSLAGLVQTTMRATCSGMGGVR